MFQGDCHDKALLAFNDFAGSDGYMHVHDVELFLRFFGMPHMWLLSPLLANILDRDHDGKISFSEFYAFKHSSLLVPVWQFMEKHHKAKIIFETIDTDQSGTIKIIFETIDTDQS